MENEKMEKAKTRKGQIGKGLSGGFAKPGFHDGFGFDLALADFELAEDGLEADEKFVPLALNGAQGVVVHLAQEADGRGGSNEGVNIVAADRAAINGRKDEF